jgi:formyltetrahydrofolate deformylase
VSQRPSASETHAARRTGILLVCCDDQPGLVAGLTQTLFDQGVNLLDADQHTDELAGKFFQRIRFDLGPEGSSPTLASVRAAVEPVARRHGMAFSLHAESERARVALFVSKTDHCLYDLLLRHRSGELPCEIPLIVSNHDTLEPVARQFGIAYAVTPVTAATRREQEARQLGLIEEHAIDLVVLARYMQILTSDFVAAWPRRIINVHHSFLPAFVGARPYHQAHTRGVKLIGATSHYVTDDLDEGPIIEQEVQRTSHRDAVADLVRKGRDLEKVVLARAVRLNLAHRLLVVGNRTVVFD